jgi:hypothetical protein
MKKIIALAVASAFAVPAFAADVTVSGDVEYYFTSSDSATTGTTGDQDVTVTGTETFDDGTVVTAFVEQDDGDADSQLTIAHPALTLEVGDDTGTAVQKYDEKSDKAEQGGIGGASAISKVIGVRISPNTGVEGLDVTLGFADDNDTAGKQITSYAVQYTMGNFTVVAGSTDQEDTDNEEGYVGVSAAFGPLTFGYDAFSNRDFTDGDDVTNYGVAYNYGAGNVFIESGERDNGTNTHEETAYGVSYQMYNVNMYVVVEDETDGISSPATDVSKTIVGVEYAF